MSSRAQAWRSPGVKYGLYAAHFFGGIATPAARNDVPFLHVILNDSEESHNLSEEYMLRAFSGGLPRSLRSLAMTLLFYVILNGSEESHRITDRAYTLLTLVVGYFADAQYDVLFLLSLRGSEATKQSPGRVEVYGVCIPYSFGGIFRLRSIWRTFFTVIAKERSDCGNPLE